MGDLIYHLFGTYFYDLFLTVSFENFSSSYCNNAAMIASLLVAGQNPLLIDVLIWVFLMSGDILVCSIDLVYGYMVHNVNVNVHLYFRLSCELVG